MKFKKPILKKRTLTKEGYPPPPNGEPWVREDFMYIRDHHIEMTACEMVEDRFHDRTPSAVQKVANKQGYPMRIGVNIE